MGEAEPLESLVLGAYLTPYLAAEDVEFNLLSLEAIALALEPRLERESVAVPVGQGRAWKSQRLQSHSTMSLISLSMACHEWSLPLALACGGPLCRTNLGASGLPES